MDLTKIYAIMRQMRWMSMRRIIRSRDFNIVFSFAAVLIATLFSRVFMHDSLLTPLFHPAIGVAFGFLILHGRKLFPSVLIGFIIGDLLLYLFIIPAATPFALISAVGFTLILFLELELGLRIVDKLKDEAFCENMRIKDAAWFFLVGSIMSFFAASLASGVYYFFQSSELSLIDTFITVFISHFLSIGIFGLMICLNKDLGKRTFSLKKTLWSIAFVLLYILSILYIVQDSSSFVFYRHNYMLVVFYILAAPLFSFITVLIMTIILYTVSSFVYLDSSWVLADFYAEVYTLLFLGLISILLSFIINWYLEDEQEANATLKKTNDSLNMTLEYIHNLLELSKNIGNFSADSDLFAKKTYELTESVFSEASALFAYYDSAGFLETLYSNHYSIKNIPGFYELHDNTLFNAKDIVVYKDVEATLNEKYGPAFMTKHPQFSNIQTRVYLVIRIKEKKHLLIALDYFKDARYLDNQVINRMHELTRLLNQLFLKNQVIEQQSALKDDIILTLVRTLDLYDKYTKGHGEVVARISKAIAVKMQLSQKEINDIYFAGLLHDIGKLGVDHGVLNSEHRLSDEEYQAIKKHVDYGYQLIKESPPLKKIARIMHEHHERHDGHGYPQGLNSHAITKGGKILSVADAVAAMSSTRPYQAKKGFKAIIKELTRHKGTQFDPDVTEACIALIKSGTLDPSE